MTGWCRIVALGIVMGMSGCANFGHRWDDGLVPNRETVRLSPAAKPGEKIDLFQSSSAQKVVARADRGLAPADPFVENVTAKAASRQAVEPSTAKRQEPPELPVIARHPHSKLRKKDLEEPPLLSQAVTVRTYPDEGPPPKSPARRSARPQVRVAAASRNKATASSEGPELASRAQGEDLSSKAKTAVPKSSAEETDAPEKPPESRKVAALNATPTAPEPARKEEAPPPADLQPPRLAEKPEALPPAKTNEELVATPTPKPPLSAEPATPEGPPSKAGTEPAAPVKPSEIPGPPMLAEAPTAPRPVSVPEPTAAPSSSTGLGLPSSAEPPVMAQAPKSPAITPPLPSPELPVVAQAPQSEPPAARPGATLPPPPPEPPIVAQAPTAAAIIPPPSPEPPVVVQAPPSEPPAARPEKVESPAPPSLARAPAMGAAAAPPSLVQAPLTIAPGAADATQMTVADKAPAAVMPRKFASIPEVEDPNDPILNGLIVFTPARGSFLSSPFAATAPRRPTSGPLDQATSPASSPLDTALNEASSTVVPPKADLVAEPPATEAVSSSPRLLEAARAELVRQTLSANRPASRPQPQPAPPIEWEKSGPDVPREGEAPRGSNAAEDETPSSPPMIAAVPASPFRPAGLPPVEFPKSYGVERDPDRSDVPPSMLADEKPTRARWFGRFWGQSQSKPKPKAKAKPSKLVPIDAKTDPNLKRSDGSQLWPRSWFSSR